LLWSQCIVHTPERVDGACNARHTMSVRIRHACEARSRLQRDVSCAKLELCCSIGWTHQFGCTELRHQVLSSLRNTRERKAVILFNVPTDK
jgi:hypothetical protein